MERAWLKLWVASLRHYVNHFSIKRILARITCNHFSARHHHWWWAQPQLCELRRKVPLPWNHASSQTISFCVAFHVWFDASTLLILLSLLSFRLLMRAGAPLLDLRRPFQTTITTHTHTNKASSGEWNFKCIAVHNKWEKARDTTWESWGTMALQYCHSTIKLRSLRRVASRHVCRQKHWYVASV